MEMDRMDIEEIEDDRIGNKRPSTETSAFSSSKRKKDDKIDEMDVDNNATSTVQIFALENNEDRLRVFVKNLDCDVVESELFEFFSDYDVNLVEIARTPEGNSRGHAEVQFNTVDEAQEALVMDGALLKNRPIQIRQIRRERDQSLIFKYAEPAEKRTIFIKNLANNTKKSEIFEFFSAYGIVKDVRLVYFENLKFKNMAYIEYENETNAKATVNLTNGMVFKGLEIEVAMATSQQPCTPKLIDKNSRNIQALKYRSELRNIATTSMATERPKHPFLPISTAVLKKIEESTKRREAEEAEEAKAGNNDDFRTKILKYAGFK